MQVNCTPPGNITIELRAARPNLGGFLQLAAEQVTNCGIMGMSNRHKSSKC